MGILANILLIVIYCLIRVRAQFLDPFIILGGLTQEDLMQLLSAGGYNGLVVRNLCINETFNNATLMENNLCLKQLEIVCRDEAFLNQMVDAASKYPYSGLLVESKIDLGNFDECIELDKTENGSRILGKHCTASTAIPTTSLDDPNLVDEAYKLSICIPDGCTAHDLKLLLKIDADLPIINDNFCYTKESKYEVDMRDWIIIIFFILILVLFIAATSYDCFCDYNERENNFASLKAFSFYSNGKRLFSFSKESSDQVEVINGLKVISMMWIIAGHSSASVVEVPSTYESKAIEFQFSWISFYITTAHVGVDTFFYISGFLLAYQYLKQRPAPLATHIKNVPGLYLNRYLRITPAVVMLYFLVIGVMEHIGDGPLYNIMLNEQKDMCLDYWWSFFLYLQNYVNYTNICIIQTWYLSTDFQLFLISPIILIPVAVLIKRHFRPVMTVLFLFNILFSIAPFVIQLMTRTFDNLYETHARLNIYFGGFMLGAFMRENGFKYRISKRINLIIWTTVIVMMIVTILIFKEMQLLMYYQDPSYISSFILLRGLWAIGLSWIIYSCQNGYGGFINKCLTIPVFKFLNRLTFCMYITHVLPLSYDLFQIRTKNSLSQLNLFYRFASYYAISIPLSIFWTLAFESPIMVIQKQLLRKQTR